MSDVAIKVEGLGKRFRLGKRERYKTFRETLVNMASAPVRIFKKKQEDADTIFWALKDVGFEVKRGEAVGIIGRNGAGKSTLLKVLSRITEPTEGTVTISGRVGSLLEVGTGFHPELSGRENIFMNGAILGMRRAEIVRKFDEIVAFAECEKFIDTPVKRYSSGMYTRLAFAVAAHLEPEVLIVDEVLAVGDAEFQKKSLGKMGEVAASGRTVLFVSHNMLAIQKLCTRVVLLKSGKVHGAGPPSELVAEYMALKVADHYSREPDGSGPVITSAKLLTAAPRVDGSVEIEIAWNIPSPVRGIKVGIGFNTQEGQRIFDFAPEDIGLRSPDEAGTYKAVLHVPAGALMARTYLISIGLWRESTVYDHVLSALVFSVEAAPVGRYRHQSQADGLVCVPCTWNQVQ